MTITFPRDFPSFCFTGACPFHLVPIQAGNLSGTGSASAVGLAPSYFEGQWLLETSDRETFGLWEAWLDTLRGSIRAFKGVPGRHRWPLKHPRGFAGMTFLGNPWTGIGNLSVIGAGRDAVTINQIPNGVMLSPGDFFSIPGASRQRIHRVTAGGTSASNQVAISCEPPIVPGVLVGVPVRLASPYCEMTLVEKSVTPRDRGRGGTISFKGQQQLV